MKHLLTCAALALAAPATAAPVVPGEISAEIARDGVDKVRDRLRGLDAITSQERFALAGLEFLSGLQGVYRWRAANDIPQMGRLFFGAAAELPPGGARAPFRPESFAETMEATIAAMDRAKAALEGLPESGEFALDVAFADLWLDVNANGTRDPGEDAAQLFLGEALPFAAPAQEGLPVIRFDRADSAWLLAYTRLVSGMGEVILAFDPTPVIARVAAAGAEIAAARAANPTNFQLGMIDAGAGPIAILMGTLGQQPDAARTRAARDRWQAMIAANRQFWTLVEQETDNEAEWIPNARQSSATGLIFPPETGALWLSVLDDAAALLDGSRTIPFWRAPIGISLAAWLDRPAPLPLDGVLQGWAVLPYRDDAPMISAENLSRFMDMLTETGPFLAMVMIN